ncbi:MAG: hypothetical protein IIC01_06055 [Planctomycetes bacterium]|nr:hypothetical protein [Planctomycetota bacterium]
MAAADLKKTRRRRRKLRVRKRIFGTLERAERDQRFGARGEGSSDSRHAEYTQPDRHPGSPAEAIADRAAEIAGRRFDFSRGHEGRAPQEAEFVHIRRARSVSLGVPADDRPFQR